MRSLNQATSDFRPDSVGWYVHLPFCRTKCGYCDFYSLPTLPHLTEQLISAICREITERNPNRPVESVFIGGGTPTELPADALDRLLRFISERTGASRAADGFEWTVEANPTSTSELKLQTLIAAGVNRISFGAQSFNEDDLRVLERLHDPKHIHESVAAAREAGFRNINLDLIYGIPGQTLDRWRDTLRRAIDLNTDHLSCYSLMYEDGTALTRQRAEGRLTPCDEDLETDMFHLTTEELTAAGFDQYEISNFAKAGRECRSNVIYWENREYLGVGPSAVSYLDGLRIRNIPDVRRYCEKIFDDPASIIVDRETLPPRERAGETAVQMLRLTRGIDKSLFKDRTGFDADDLFSDSIRRFKDMGLIEGDERSIRLTRSGFLVANRIMQEFLLNDDGAGRSQPLPRSFALPVVQADEPFAAS